MFPRLHGSLFPSRRWVSLLCQFILLTFWPLVWQSASAAPLLIDEAASPGDFANEMWFKDVLETGDFSEGLAEAPVTGRLPARANSAPAMLIEIDNGSAQGANASLKELVRSYINTRQAVSEVAGQTIWSSERSASFSDRISALPPSTRSGAHEMLANVVNSIVEPVVGSTDTMSFSILGFGEFTLLSKREGLSLSLGDTFSFTLLGSTGEAPLPGAFPSAGMGWTMGATDTAAASEGLYSGSAAGASGGTGGEVGGEWQNHPRQITRAFALAFDILTYPGTLLILLMVLLLPLVNQENKYRRTKLRSGRQLKMRRQPRRRRRRNSSVLTLPPPMPMKQEAVK